ncbi:hypothetical protein Verru16b_01530 [Lacunisphaera limnophila]|uniref:Competence protein A n=1 Tax=Lacunisphaera limnophila TaxID=1838286 RepID=A0A1D8AUC1_9BACT|nr:hypothetical protein [Lacunisphaera limnophila]AOS44468.1 hypothetical protein Verru16b_01530 [Lacunisphaera limnophila]
MLLSNRNSRRSLLIEHNPFQILAAGITRADSDGTVTIDCAAEFDRDDDAGLRHWLAQNFEKQNAWVPAVASFSPPEALFQRESLQPRKLADADYLPELVKDQYKIEQPANWKLQVLSPLEGELIPAEGTQRPGLICGVSHTDVHLMQQQLLDHRLLPYRLEMSILPLLGAVAEHQARVNDKRAIVVVVIEQEHTVAYILGKEGVHTPATVRNGFSSIVQAARREFELTTAAEVRQRLQQPDDELLLRASKFVRAIGRDLKPLVDSYEMTTGQPVGSIYCAYLPPALSWIAEPLAQVVGRTPFTFDCAAWQTTVGIQTGGDVTAPGHHWLGALSLVADLPGSKPEQPTKGDAAYRGPWRIDCRISAALPSSDLIRRRFIGNAVAATLASAVLIFTLWQFYTSGLLSTEISYWQQQIAENDRAFKSLNADAAKLDALVKKLDAAHALVHAPYVTSDLILEFGRTRLERMSLERIDGFREGLVLRGILREPSTRASQTLRTYVDTLRRDPKLGPLFSSVVLVSLERNEEANQITFEIACRLKEPAP